MTTEPKRFQGDLVASSALFGFAMALLLSFAPFSRPLGMDPATWDLMAIFLPEGLIPYRDIFLHKTPGAAYIGGLGAVAAPWLGAEPVHGAHFLFLLMSAACPALLYRVCRPRMPTALALGAALFLLAFDQWLLASVEGVRPKIATIFFGLCSLLGAARDRPFVTGVFGSLAAICWQPGVAFLAGAFFELTRRSTGARRRRLSSLAAGAVLPIVILFVMLAWTGALADFWAQAVTFNVHYAIRKARSPLATLERLVEIGWKWNPWEGVLLLLAGTGWGLSRSSASKAIGMPAGLTVAGLLYLAAAFVNMQQWPDTLLLLPPAAAAIASGLGRTLSWLRPGSALSWVVPAVAVVAVARVEARALWPDVTFEDQRLFMQELARDLEEDDEVLVIGFPEFSVHTGRLSIWRWPYLWSGIDLVASRQTDGGFPAMLRELEEIRPELILRARRWDGKLRRQFDGWAIPRYRHETVRFHPHVHGRPIHVYRPRAGDERVSRRLTSSPTR